MKRYARMSQRLANLAGVRQPQLPPADDIIDHDTSYMQHQAQGRRHGKTSKHHEPALSGRESFQQHPRGIPRSRGTSDPASSAQGLSRKWGFYALNTEILWPEQVSERLNRTVRYRDQAVANSLSGFEGARRTGPFKILRSRDGDIPDQPRMPRRPLKLTELS